VVARTVLSTSLGRKIDLLGRWTPAVVPPTVQAYRAFANASPPTTGDSDASAVTLGVEFSVSAPATLTQIHWWQPNGSNTGAHTVMLYSLTSGSNTALSAVQSFTPAGSGWQTVTLTTPIALTVGTRYLAAVWFPSFPGYAATGNYFAGSGPGAAGTVNGPLTVPQTSQTVGGNGRYSYGSSISYPASSFSDTNYWIDVTVTTTTT
jgi:hypothetical protein